MTQKSIDIKQISKENCETEDCPNKASTISKRKYLCKECFNRKSLHRKYRNLKYINYLQHMI